jgi:peptidoglycan/LPS O-acetylase OafA/YrhL
MTKVSGGTWSGSEPCEAKRSKSAGRPKHELRPTPWRGRFPPAADFLHWFPAVHSPRAVAMSQGAALDAAPSPMPRLSFQPGRHLPRLDGLRGVAIALVMLHHFTIYGGMQPRQDVDRLFYALGRSAWVGVDLFFVLSGFLITGILLDAEGDRGYFRNFYARRSLRIFPLYYGVLIVAFWLVPLLIPSSPAFGKEVQAQGWYWAYLVNFRTARDGWPGFPGLGHFWSLAVEEQFYLLWPAAIFLCSRLMVRRLCLGLILGSLTLRTGLSLSGEHYAAYVLMPARADALAVGALLAATIRDPISWTTVQRWARPVGMAAAASLLALFLVDGELDAERMAVQTIGFTLIAAVCAALLVTAIEGETMSLTGRALASRPLRFLGRYSYGLYVFHHLLVFGLAGHLLNVARMPRLAGSQIPGQLLFLAVATGASIALALLSWHCLEQPFLRLKHLFPYQSGISGSGQPEVEPARERAA